MLSWIPCYGYSDNACYFKLYSVMSADGTVGEGCQHSAGCTLRLRLSRDHNEPGERGCLIASLGCPAAGGLAATKFARSPGEEKNIKEGAGPA